MVFGDRSQILAKVEKRVQELKKSYPKAMAINPEDVRVIFIITDDAQKYWKHAAV
jgi:formate dehydrogenase iron-sulfur subunit